MFDVIFKHAWREFAGSSPTGVNFLAKSRLFRNRMWWEVFKVKRDYYRRRQENLVHAFSGPFTQWEDIFCDYFGVDWRVARDSCKSLFEWMGHFPQFASSTCRSYGLFCPGGDSGSEEPKQEQEPPQKAQKIKHTIDLANIPHRMLLIP